MRFFLVAWVTTAVLASAGCSTDVEQTASTSPTASAEQEEAETDDAAVSTDRSSSTSTLTSTSVATTSTLAPSTTTSAPTTAPSTTTTAAPTTSTTATTATTATSTTTEPVEEAIGGYSDWNEFWPVFSAAAASGDVATIEALTAGEVTLIYSGGSLSTYVRPKEEFMGHFTRPQEVFEQGRETFDDGTVFTAELLAPGQWSLFHQLAIDYDVGYSIFIEEGEGGPASASEYIFRDIDGEFLLVGYSRDH